MRAILGNRVALGILAASVLLALALRFWPALARWGGLSTYMILWGILAYACLAAVMHRVPKIPTPPDIEELLAVRRFFAAKRRERLAAGGGNAELDRILAEAIADLDNRLAPAIRQLLARERELRDALSRYERWQLPAPEPAVLDRLKSLHARQQAAIAQSRQQVSNAAATLVALLQEGDDLEVARQARNWSADLLNLYDALAGILHEDEALSAKGLA